MLIEEGPFPLASEQLEIIIIKSEGVMALEFLAISQCDGLCVGVLILISPASLMLVFTILVLAILLPFGCSLLDSSGVFVSIRDVRVLPNNFLLQIGHSLEVSAIRILGSLDCGSVHMFQLRISDLTQ